MENLGKWVTPCKLKEDGIPIILITATLISAFGEVTKKDGERRSTEKSFVTFRPVR